ncbi:hypothetical protein AB0C76_23380 [Kitasatospora sp. NPDC048722]|uniref:hypothetical protein n=1 Tax=Kitasatospora sp. NPDC048722 TaxID=3155639 RepID=UPI0033C20FEC
MAHRIEHEPFDGVEKPRRRFAAVHRPKEIDARIPVVHDEGDPVVGPDCAHRLKAAHGDRHGLLLTRGRAPAGPSPNPPSSTEPSAS